ncbi:MAG: hypothetical protein GVY30_05080 [Chloroflexi bacterium]|nr:hypothetical protein [Chloroflexota bacterium]
MRILDILYYAFRSMKLVPVTTPKRQAKFGSAKGLIKMTEDFDAPSNDFEDYMP